MQELDEFKTFPCLWVWTLGPQLVNLFRKLMEPLEGEALLEKVCCWGVGFAAGAIVSLLFCWLPVRRCTVLNQPSASAAFV